MVGDESANPQSFDGLRPVEDLSLTVYGHNSPDGSAEELIIATAQKCGWPVDIEVVARGLVGCVTDWIRDGRFPSDVEASSHFMRYWVLPEDFSEDPTKLSKLNEGLPPGIFAVDLGYAGADRAEVASRVHKLMACLLHALRREYPCL